MSEVARTADNGVNVEALLGAREALTAAPEAARFVWRAASEWKGGTHTESTVEGFFGLGEEQKHVRECDLNSEDGMIPNPPRLVDFVHVLVLSIR